MENQQKKMCVYCGEHPQEENSDACQACNEYFDDPRNDSGPDMWANGRKVRKGSDEYYHYLKEITAAKEACHLDEEYLLNELEMKNHEIMLLKRALREMYLEHVLGLHILRGGPLG